MAELLVGQAQLESGGGLERLFLRLERLQRLVVRRRA